MRLFHRYGYPAFVAINPKDGKYSSLREAFDEANALHFVESLRSVRNVPCLGFRACVIHAGRQNKICNML